MNSTQPKASISPTGWWLAALLEKREPSESRPKSVYWENHILVRALGWREAFQKALALGERSADVGQQAFSDKPCFIGITDLVPIFEPFEDGSEILWNEFDVDDGEESPSVYTMEELAVIYGSEEDRNVE